MGQRSKRSYPNAGKCCDINAGVVSLIAWFDYHYDSVFYNFFADGALSRGVFLILMGIVILAVQNRRNKKPKNRIRANSH